MISMHKGFIERNETNDIKVRVLEGIAKIEKDHELDKLSIDKIVEKIAQADVLSDSLVTMFGVVSTSYAYFKHISKRATIEKLEELTEHSSYVVQCYAFAALTQKAPDKLFKIIKSKLHITKKIKTVYFDILGRVRVADFFIYEGLPFLTAEQYNYIVDEVLEHNYDLDFKSNYFLELKPDEKNYERIRKFVIEFNDPYALVALAKFQKDSDIEIIKSFSKGDSWQFYEAVKIFPHPSFWNLLLKIYNMGLEAEETYRPNIDYLYKAISVYHNVEAKEVLTNSFDKIKNQDFVKSHAEAIFRAIKTFKDGFYDKLLFKLWKDYNLINLEIFDYLWDKNSDLCLEIINISLNDPNKLSKIFWNSSFYGNIGTSIDESEEFAAKIIKLFIAKDKKNAFKAIKKNILYQNVSYLPIFTKIVSDLLEDDFIEVLFERFSNDKNYDVYCDIAKCLLEYNSPEINKKLLKIIKNKSYLQKSWELREILNKKAVK
ncbi:MAG: hypothetical protein ACFFBH_10300 [Promethearchaeota archaeon]